MSFKRIFGFEVFIYSCILFAINSPYETSISNSKKVSFLSAFSFLIKELNSSEDNFTNSSAGIYFTSLENELASPGPSPPPVSMAAPKGKNSNKHEERKYNSRRSGIMGFQKLEHGKDIN